MNDFSLGFLLGCVFGGFYGLVYGYFVKRSVDEFIDAKKSAAYRWVTERVFHR